MAASRERLNRSQSLHQQVARTIRNDIAAGVLRHGQALPSSRVLAQEWGVSVFTITEAMKVLAEEGIVLNQSRSKRVVNAPDQTLRNDLRAQNPHVIIIGGYAGSGKTELGRILARETGWSMLDKDTITRPVVEAALEILDLSPNDRESEDYLTKIRPREYEALMAAVEENLACGNSVIATAPFIREFNDAAWLARTEASFASKNAAISLVWVYCDPNTMHTYIRHRGAARDAAKLGNWSGYLSGIDVAFRPAVPHSVIDNSVSSEPLQNQARNLLKEIINTKES
ncbi:AAA family ATPase [Streptosporangium saharense]|uniref:DNA-binding transcriptional regulator YhcF (GntR family) n=1 Tax=Streptosporangium saharense TaxID=1706840 RepID=A0A7W7QPN7_9ACTN|nr:GntR family transcriptional regulator [Streptosporangium saharense]MBB4917432.1 DNA-binding transcriptional regulator YhcF (GntR family) [Streptosporangium saharense]